MKNNHHIAAFLIIVIMISPVFFISAHANSAAPPNFTIMVINPPDDLSLSLKLKNHSQIGSLEVRKEKKAWEVYYKFYDRHMSGYPDLDQAVLQVQSSEKTFQCSLPESVFEKYDSLLTLDLKSEMLKAGQPLLRIPFLVTMRVFLTLLIEAAIFYLFGYRTKQSWHMFLIINLATQGLLNAVITGPGSSYMYWMICFVFGEILIFCAEMAAFTCLVREHRRCCAAVYSVIANSASLLLGGALLMYLPI